MGAQVRYGTIAVGAYGAHWPGSHQGAFTDQYRPPWDRGGGRGPFTQRYPLWSGWSFGARVGGGDLEGYAVVREARGYEPFSCDGAGTQTKRFIRGITKDADGNAISDVIVQGFVTSDDRYVGQDVSRTDGTYLLGTETVAGVQHYLVAYKPGSPDIGGTSVNTITSTNVDGT